MRGLKRKKGTVYFLTGFFLFSAVGMILLGLPILMVLEMNPIPQIVYGIPLGNGLYIWWTNFSYIFISLGAISMLYFIKTVFEKPNKIITLIYIALIIVFNIWSIYHGIFVFEGGESSLTLPMAALYLGLNLFMWLLLFVYGWKTSRRSRKNVFRTGMVMISMSGLSMIVSFFLIVAGILFVPIRIYAQIFNILTAFLIYLGYFLPSWFRNLLIRLGVPKE